MRLLRSQHEPEPTPPVDCPPRTVFHRRRGIPSGLRQGTSYLPIHSSIPRSWDGIVFDLDLDLGSDLDLDLIYSGHHLRNICPPATNIPLTLILGLSSTLGRSGFADWLTNHQP